LIEAGKSLSSQHESQGVGDPKNNTSSPFVEQTKRWAKARAEAGVKRLEFRRIE
jgi:hypothetical protein